MPHSGYATAHHESRSRLPPTSPSATLLYQDPASTAKLICIVIANWLPVWIHPSYPETESSGGCEPSSQSRHGQMVINSNEHSPNNHPQSKPTASSDEVAIFQHCLRHARTRQGKLPHPSSRPYHRFIFPRAAASRRNQPSTATILLYQRHIIPTHGHRRLETVARARTHARRTQRPVLAVRRPRPALAKAVYRSRYPADMTSSRLLATVPPSMTSR